MSEIKAGTMGLKDSNYIEIQVKGEDVIFPKKSEVTQIENVKRIEKVEEQIQEIQIVQREQPSTDWITRLARILKDNPDLVTQIFIIAFCFLCGYFIGSSSTTGVFTKAGFFNFCHTSIWAMAASGAVLIRLCILSGKINLAIQSKASYWISKIFTKISKPCNVQGQSFVSDGYQKINR